MNDQTQNNETEDQPVLKRPYEGDTGKPVQPGKLGHPNLFGGVLSEDNTFVLSEESEVQL